MLKKIISCAMSAIIMTVSYVSVFSVSALETDTEYIYNDNISVFDAVKIKRSLLAGETSYTMEDYEYTRDILLRKRSPSKEYAKKVIVQYDLEEYKINDTYADPSVLDPKFVYVGSTIKIAQHTLTKEGSSHGGWLYNGEVYKDGQSFTVPDENVVFTPYWFNYHTITYFAGDYDDVVDYPRVTLQGTEGVGMELAESTRFTRPGYKLAGWKCDLDGIEYGTGARYIVPDTNVVFTAIWEKAEVNISISANNGHFYDRITDKAYTGDEYVLPECTFTNGDKTFCGWLYDGVVYQPGDSIIIPVLAPGKSVVVTAKWIS